MESYNKDEDADEANDEPSSASPNAWRSPIAPRRCRVGMQGEVEAAAAAGAIASCASAQSAGETLAASVQRDATPVAPWELRWAMLAMQAHKLQKTRRLKLIDALRAARLATKSPGSRLIGVVHDALSQELHTSSPADEYEPPARLAPASRSTDKSGTTRPARRSWYRHRRWWP